MLARMTLSSSQKGNGRELTRLASWQSMDEVTDPEPRVEPGRLRTVHQVSNETSTPSEAVTGVELGAVLGVGNKVVLRVLRDLRANLVVS